MHQPRADPRPTVNVHQAHTHTEKAKRKQKPSREVAPGRLDRASGFPFPREDFLRPVFPSMASSKG